MKLTVLVAPEWHRGYIVNTVLTVGWFAIFMIGQYLWRMDIKKSKYTPDNSSQDELKDEKALHVEIAEKEAEETQISRK